MAAQYDVNLEKCALLKCLCGVHSSCFFFCVFYKNFCLAMYISLHRKDKFRYFTIHPVMNPVHGLSSTCHQRSLFHYIDSHTTQTVTCHSSLQFPSSIALITHSHLLPITQFISSGLPRSDCRVLFCIYHSPSDSCYTEPFHVSV